MYHSKYLWMKMIIQNDVCGVCYHSMGLCVWVMGLCVGDRVSGAGMCV